MVIAQESADLPGARLSTRLSFLVAGFAMACWAPLIPLAKQRLCVDERGLGLLLLCMGVGSVGALLAAGALSARHGSRPVILISGLVLAVTLPMLATAGSPGTLGLALLAFGAGLGSLDVAMNVHAVEVERAEQRPLMSGFHALFSVGGIAGAGLMTFLLSMQVGALVNTLACSVLIATAMAAAGPRLLCTKPSVPGRLFVRPRGIVLVLGVLAAVAFLVEGAILDWGAVFITGANLVGADGGGVGYVLFSIAMTAGRLGGDAVTARIGDRATLLNGSLVAIAGLVMLLVAPVTGLALAGFVLIGLGVSNLAPILFRRAGGQPAMPPALAIAAITTAGYAGILMGPAAIGFVADAASLSTALWMLAGLLCLVPLAAGMVTAPGR